MISATSRCASALARWSAASCSLPQPLNLGLEGAGLRDLALGALPLLDHSIAGRTRALERDPQGHEQDDLEARPRFSSSMCVDGGGKRAGGGAYLVPSEWTLSVAPSVGKGVTFCVP